MSKSYVLGILFMRDESSDTVILVRKKRPAHHKGLLNGIGGKVEKGEDLFNAMCRECYEETGLAVNNWINFGVVSGVDFIIDLYHATIPYRKLPTHHISDDLLVLVDVESVAALWEEFVPATPSIIMAALNHRKYRNSRLHIRYDTVDEKTLDISVNNV